MSEGDSRNILEQEIVKLERDLAFKKQELEQKKESGEINELPHEKETLRQVIGEKIGLSKTNPSTDSGQASGGRKPTAALPFTDDIKAKVQELTNVAFGKSIEEAIKQARATDNAALIDAFHDALVDELYDYLIERGKLKKL